eukprot:6228726-Pyramimonas_sp.AAC.1
MGVRTRRDVFLRRVPRENKNASRMRRTAAVPESERADLGRRQDLMPCRVPHQDPMPFDAETVLYILAVF